MDDGKENTVQVFKLNSGTTRHCCYGTCNSDSRYAERPHMKNVGWIPFPKPKTNKEKCERWLRACGRKNFTVEKVKKWTYICTKHFIGGAGPTDEHPDPIPATFTPQEVDRFSRKRKAPTPRAAPVSKRQLFEAAEALRSLQDSFNHADLRVESFTEQSEEKQMRINECNAVKATTESTTHGKPIMNSQESQAKPSMNSQEVQTLFHCTDLLTGKIQKSIDRNQAKILKKEVNSSRFHFDALSKKTDLFKFYTGISVEQFNHLFICLGDVVNNLIYWKGKKKSSGRIQKSKSMPSKRRLTPKNEMLLSLIKLRQAFPNNLFKSFLSQGR